MTADFDPIKRIELREADDHYVIQLIKEGTNYVSEFPFKMTSAIVKVLCKIFEIPYDPKWSIILLGNEQYGTQITINKGM